MRHFLIFGSHPALSLAEAESVIGAQASLVADRMAVFDLQDWDGAALQERLGGTVKLGDVIFEGKMAELTAERLASIIEESPRAKKIEFGLTVYGASEVRERFQKLPIEVKRLLKARGRSVRWVTGDRGEVAPAAVAKAGLTDQGYDFCIGVFGARVIIGLSTHVQDADAWSKRDYGRPFRDARTGMLPPKLARMMVNLAHGTRETLLDPFCGSGTVLMEAALLSRNSQLATRIARVIGSDIDQKQLAGAERNLHWLQEQGLLSAADRKRIELMQADAAALDQQLRPGSAQAIVTEGTLGKPLTGRESRKQIETQQQEIEALWRNCLPVFARLQPKRGVLVCVWPQFVVGRERLRVELQGEAEKAGYGAPERWLYHRPDQRVERQILRFVKRS